MLERHRILEPVWYELARDGNSVPSGEAVPVVLSESAFTGKFILRALEPINACTAPLLGVDLPEKPNTIASADNMIIFWLRERQWWVVTAHEAAATVYRALEKSLAGLHSDVVDVSDYYTVLKLSGEKARDVLMKGCPLDLHPKVFPAGAMAQSRIAHAGVLLHHRSASDYDVYIRNSFAEYLVRWLYDAALEYGVRITQNDKESA